MKVIDLSNKVFNRWKVIKRFKNTPQGQSQWVCKCICGKRKILKSLILRKNISKSCGCWKIEELATRNKKHGHSSSKRITPTYHTWAGMKARCTNKKHTSFKNYEGRGITFCERWNKFSNFLADMGTKPAGLSLDRIDNHGNYCFDNCRWATPKQQANNKRSK